MFIRMNSKHNTEMSCDWVITVMRKRITALQYSDRIRVVVWKRIYPCSRSCSMKGFAYDIYLFLRFCFTYVCVCAMKLDSKPPCMLMILTLIPCLAVHSCISVV